MEPEYLKVYAEQKGKKTRMSLAEAKQLAAKEYSNGIRGARPGLIVFFYALLWIILTVGICIARGIIVL